MKRKKENINADPTIVSLDRKTSIKDIKKAQKKRKGKNFQRNNFGKFVTISLFASIGFLGYDVVQAEMTDIWNSYKLSDFFNTINFRIAASGGLIKWMLDLPMSIVCLNIFFISILFGD